MRTRWPWLRKGCGCAFRGRPCSPTRRKAPVPLGQAPATPFNSDRADIAWSRLQREERPGSGCRGVFWRIIQACETLPTGFQERLLLGPTIDNGRAVEVAREPVQIL